MKIEHEIDPRKQDCMDPYLLDLKETLLLSAAALGISLLIWVFAWATAKLFGPTPGFDLALNSLLHYPKLVNGIIAFSATVFVLCCLTVILEGWPPAILVRKWIVVPALGLAKHMLALTAGVLVAWALFEPLADLTYTAVLNQLWPVVSTAAFLLIFSFLFSAIVTFFDLHYDQLHKKWGRLFSLLILVLAISSAISVCRDLRQIQIPEVKVHD